MVATKKKSVAKRMRSEMVRLRACYIAEEWNEGHPDNGGDGYWIALKPGWKSAEDPVGCVHIIHGDTRALAHAVDVMPCACDDCRKL